MGKQSGLLAVLAIMAVVSVGFCSAANNFTVGGTTGWTVPPSPSFYSTWASHQVVQVGDVLVFNFPSGGHTVAAVSKEAYDSCDTTKLLTAAVTTAPAHITLNKTGTHYFICTVPGHCSAGQKLAATVNGQIGSASALPPAATFAAIVLISCASAAATGLLV